MEEGYRLKFIFIGNQNNNIKNKNFQIHIIYYSIVKRYYFNSRLMRRVLNLNINKQDHAIELLKRIISAFI